MKPRQSQATVTATATISVTIARKTAASKSDICHMAQPLGSSDSPCRSLYSMGLHRSHIDLPQRPFASSRSDDFACPERTHPADGSGQPAPDRAVVRDYKAQVRWCCAYIEEGPNAYFGDFDDFDDEFSPSRPASRRSGIWWSHLRPLGLSERTE